MTCFFMSVTREVINNKIPFFLEKKLAFSYHLIDIFRKSGSFCIDIIIPLWFNHDKFKTKGLD